jgi:hypothetical protein
MRSGPQPGAVGLPENPYPGIDGITTWNASEAFPPCAVGSVSGSTIFSCSTTEPGQPCVTISGSASSCFERAWMKWMSSPSISVTACGKAFSFASHLRQSYRVAQYRASSWIVASCTPCDWSATVSFSGQIVALTRARSASSLVSGTSTMNGRIAVVPADTSVVDMWVSLDPGFCPPTVAAYGRAVVRPALSGVA